MSACVQPELIPDADAVPERRDRSREQLVRIAAALRLPADAFFGEAETTLAATSSALPDARETLELLGLFEAIIDPVKKQACLAFVRAAVERG